MSFFLKFKIIEYLSKLLWPDYPSRAIKTEPIVPVTPASPSTRVKKTGKTTGQTEKTTRELMVQVDLAKNMTTVFSQYPSGENLIMQLDALCVTVTRCIEEGEDPERIYQKVKFYLDTVIMRYSPRGEGKPN